MLTDMDNVTSVQSRNGQCQCFINDRLKFVGLVLVVTKVTIVAALVHQCLIQFFLFF